MQFLSLSFFSVKHIYYAHLPLFTHFHNANTTLCYLYYVCGEQSKREKKFFATLMACIPISGRFFLHSLLLHHFITCILYAAKPYYYYLL